MMSNFYTQGSLGCLPRDGLASIANRSKDIVGDGGCQGAGAREEGGRVGTTTILSSTSMGAIANTLNYGTDDLFIGTKGPPEDGPDPGFIRVGVLDGSILDDGLFWTAF